MEDSTDQDVHRGYEFEEGMFARIRSWVDVAPWIRLGRAMRLLSSPPSFVAVLLVIVLWNLAGFATPLPLRLADVFAVTQRPFSVVSLFEPRHWTEFAKAIAVIVVGIPCFQFVARSGVVLCAGHPPPPVRQTIQMVRERMISSLVLPLIPMGCLAVFVLLAWIARVPGAMAESPAWDALVGVGLAIACLPVGILGFGACFAIPMALVAMVAEPDPDPIDSLSRGYEYLYRRPLQLTFYLGIGLVLVLVSQWIAEGVCETVRFAADQLSENQVERAGAEFATERFLEAWVSTLTIGIIGGIYLLLRYNAGGQEVEDIYLPPATSDVSLPELPDDAYDS
ncbi:MAG: hypothetical protein AAF802_05425 [Planctomycetota bacterium]